MEETLYLTPFGLSRSEKNSLSVMLPKRLQRPVSWDAPERVHCALVNLDLPGAIAQYETFRADHPDTPTIGLSFEARDFEGIRVLKRPVAIQDILQVIQGLATKTDLGGDGAVPSTSKARAHHPDAPAVTGLTGFLKRAYEKTLATKCHHRVSGETLEHAFLFLNNGFVYSAYKPGIIRSLGALYGEDLQGIRITPVSEAGSQAILAQERPGFLYESGNLLWEIAYGAVQNDLPPGLEPTDVLRLRHWPNCTNLRHPLSSVLLSALFHQRPWSIDTITAHAKLPREKVVRFVSTAYLLGYLVPDEREPPTARKPVGKRPTHSSTLHSLMRKVMGRLFGQTTRGS